ncbi:hypothetical protein A6J53_14745 [Neisseria meningitidis]|uniref:Uncharacterized protein n=2 Tax=Neisseria meningitidis TaxID=487 RepID=A0A0U1RIK4_NEIMA|nr:hypothetical protein A6J53_14745 [Neisseria meningitidis]CAM08364.1 hypothetical protein NMA1158 [Neisseria meningitidis Z2491]CBA05504.1 hypothetical protein NMO_0860 [Neisseria meningitidis alpha14]MBG8633162.1 hypothetical protein [Neisseria meningitidis]MBG8659810.1 hypothetical protein [Neisseria meningitidis]
MALKLSKIMLNPKQVNIKGIPHFISEEITLNISNNVRMPDKAIKIPKNIRTILIIWSYLEFF